MDVFFTCYRIVYYIWALYLKGMVFKKEFNRIQTFIDMYPKILLLHFNTLNIFVFVCLFDCVFVFLFVHASVCLGLFVSTLVCISVTVLWTVCPWLYFAVHYPVTATNYQLPTRMFLLYISPSLSVFRFRPDSSFFGDTGLKSGVGVYIVHFNHFGRWATPPPPTPREFIF